MGEAPVVDGGVLDCGRLAQSSARGWVRPPDPLFLPLRLWVFFEGSCRSGSEQRTMVTRRNGDGRRSFPAIAVGDEGRGARGRTSFGRRLGEAPAVRNRCLQGASPKRRPEEGPAPRGPAAALHLRLPARAGACWSGGRSQSIRRLAPGSSGQRECRHGDCRLCGATQGNYEGEIPPAKHSPTYYRDRKWSQLQSNPAKIPSNYRGTATTGPPTERDLPPLVPLAETPGALS
jgi:hypothetical protein